jgi:uncharacterized membrane protein
MRAPHFGDTISRFYSRIVRQQNSIDIDTGTASLGRLMKFYSAIKYIVRSVGWFSFFKSFYQFFAPTKKELL